MKTRRGVIAQESPSIAGNHMIAAIELPPEYKPEQMYSVVRTSGGKRFLLFDPTWEKTPFGQIEHELQGSDALLVDGAASQAIRIPVLDARQNTLERRANFHLSADGDLTGEVEEHSGGDLASGPRHVFSSADEREQRKYLERRISEDLLSFHVGDVKLEHVRDLQKDFSLRYSLQAEHFARIAGPLLMVRPRVLGRESFALDRPGVHNGERGRTLPIDLGSTRTIHDDCVIELPAGYTADDLPAPMDVDVGFASYRSRVTLAGSARHYDGLTR